MTRFARITAGAWALTLCICFHAHAGLTAYDGIDFRGLKILSRDAIMNAAGMTMLKGKYIVDRGRIDEYLGKETLVRSYKLIDKNNRLIIVVDEREIRYLVGVRKGELSRFVEVDGSLMTVSDRVHRGDVPLIMVDRADIEGNSFSKRVRVFVSLLTSARVRGRMAGEIESVQLNDDGTMYLTLRGRPTLFVATANEAGFMRCAAVAGWCDKMRRYPSRLLIRDEFSVIR
jgi:hypothetical protein